MSHSILIVTLPPLTGGVPAKTEILCRHLRSLGHRVTVSHYATLSDYPDLVAPIWQWPSGKKPGIREGRCFGDFPSVAIGCRFPELEFQYYRPSAFWRKLIDGHDRHIAVGGTVLASFPLARAGTPYLVWCASTMIADREDRRAAMPLARRLLDRLIVGPVQRVMEREILVSSARFMAISSYTRDSLIAAGGMPERFSQVPIPVDTDRFRPPDSAPDHGVIGFAGRPGDPRKNLGLLFGALKRLLDQGEEVSLRLTGEETPELAALSRRLSVSDHVTWTGWLNEGKLSDFYRGLDVFVIPSLQEGLNIAGVQAMASGVPVVSTRCGGPEDYVIDEETGSLVSFEEKDMARAIGGIVNSRELRGEMSAKAREKMRTFRQKLLSGVRADCSTK